MSSRRLVRCPRCGYEFSLYYARAVACEGCPLSARGCRYIRCPRCGHEFSL